jgi:hypothetical protein
VFWPGSGADFDLRKAFKEFVRPTNGQCSFFLLSSLKMCLGVVSSRCELLLCAGRNLCAKNSSVPSFLPSLLLLPFWWCWLALGLGIPLFRDEREPRWNHKSSAKRSPSRFTPGTIVTHSHRRVANPFVARFRYRLSAFVFLSLCLLQLRCCNFLTWLNLLTCSSACLS